MMFKKLSFQICWILCAIWDACALHPRRKLWIADYKLNNKAVGCVEWQPAAKETCSSPHWYLPAARNSIPHLSSRSLVLDEECRVALPVKQGQEYHIFHKRDASARPSKSELYSGWCFILRIAKQQTTSARACLHVYHLNYINFSDDTSYYNADIDICRMTWGREGTSDIWE